MPLLVEKYRPQTLEELVGFVPTFSIDESLPHLLLFGPPGVGKTTFAKIVANILKCDYIILNSSEERGIDVIREKVKTFACTQSTDKNIKLIILDEADATTGDAQNSLRNLMETYSSNCRFILTANYPTKIIDPIQSRCVKVDFSNINKSDIVKRLEFICKQESIPFEHAALEKIVERNGSDLRSSINKLEELKTGVVLNKLNNETKVAMAVFAFISKNDFINARQTYLDNNPDNEQFLKDIYEVIFNSENAIEYKKMAILEICEAYKSLKVGSWPQIVIEAMLVKIITG
jgi:replication factor C small subunit